LTLPRNGIAVVDELIDERVEVDDAACAGGTARSEPVVGAEEKRNIIEKDAMSTARDRRAARAMDRSRRRREAGAERPNSDDGADPRAATAATTTATRLRTGSIPGGRYEDRGPGPANDGDIDDDDDDENGVPRAAMAGGGMGGRKASTRRRPPPPPAASRREDYGGDGGQHTQRRRGHRGAMRRGWPRHRGIRDDVKVIVSRRRRLWGERR